MRTRLPLAAPVRYFESGLPKVPRPLQRIYAKSSIEVAECAHPRAGRKAAWHPATRPRDGAAHPGITNSLIVI
jgi:hypothetical protein